MWMLNFTLGLMFASMEAATVDHEDASPLIGSDPIVDRTDERAEPAVLPDYWYCGCTGVCGDGTTAGSTGGGSSIGIAIDACLSDMIIQCANHLQLKSYVGTGCSEA
jgi:hypothetical protein